LRWIAGFIALGFWLHTCPAAEPPLNEMCPVMTEEKADPSITVTYQGRTIAFCCETCVRKFSADPEKYVSRLAGFSGEKAEEVASPIRLSGSSIAGVEIPERQPLLARLHPVIVHFPLAGFPLAFIGFLIFRVTGRDHFASADVPPVLVATVAAALAVVSGNLAETSMSFSPSMRIIAERHEYAGTTLLVLGIVLSLVRLWRRNRLNGTWGWVYGGGLALSCFASMATGYLGGSLVFGPEHLRL